MKILFFGDSITDAARMREEEKHPAKYGSGFVMQILGRLYSEAPGKHTALNKGISGNRVVDLYARIKSDVWNEEPDVISILVGVNDLWHGIMHNNGVDLERFEKVYDMLISDTLKRLPNVKIVLCEPFVLHGFETDEHYDEFLQVYEYAKVVKRLAEKHGLYFLPLQAKLAEMADRFGAEHYLFDGVHPNVAGSALIAEEWLKLFKREIEE